MKDFVILFLYVSLCIWIFGRRFQDLEDFAAVLMITGCLRLNLFIERFFQKDVTLHVLGPHLLGMWASALVYLLDWNTDMIKWPFPTIMAIVATSILNLFYKIPAFGGAQTSKEIQPAVPQSDKDK